MSVLDAPELVAVNVGPCRCKGAPHTEGDVVSLWPEMPLEGGVAAHQAIASHNDVPSLKTALSMVYTVYGVADWTFVRDDGLPIPVTRENVARALPFSRGGFEVANRAAELYDEAVTAPLVRRQRASSNGSLTAISTSAKTPSSQRPRKRSG